MRVEVVVVIAVVLVVLLVVVYVATKGANKPQATSRNTDARLAHFGHALKSLKRL